MSLTLPDGTGEPGKSGKHFDGLRCCFDGQVLVAMMFCQIVSERKIR